MAEKKLAIVCLICIILVVGFIGVVMTLNKTETEMRAKAEHISEIENEKNKLETQISNLQTQNTILNNQVSNMDEQIFSLQNETDKLEYEKGTLETQISSLQSERDSLEAQNESFQSEITSLDNEMVTLEAQISNLQNEVTDLKDAVVQSYNLGYFEGETDGYQLGYDEGYTQGTGDAEENGWYIRDPTYTEMIAFIDSDKTDENNYTEDYVCYDFTADFNANAFQAGYRCGFVYIEFFDGAHAITCFKTTDRGLTYIEPQTDEIVTIAIGKLYKGHMIKDMGIIW